MNSEFITWAEKYRPKKFTDIIFSNNMQCEVLRWLKNWSHISKPLLLSGPPGYGKTSLIHILARMLNYNLIELNAADNRTVDLGKKVIDLYAHKTFDGKKNFLLIDEVDNIAADTFFIKSLIKNSIKARFPIILTSNTKLNCVDIDFDIINLKLPNPITVFERIKNILKAEQKVIDNKLLLNIIEGHNLDFRSILNHLQVNANEKNHNLTYKTIEKNNFKLIEEVLGAKRDKFILYERNYTPQVAQLAHNNYYNSNITFKNCVSVAMSHSEIENLPAEYQFLGFERLNRSNIYNLTYERLKVVDCKYKERKDHAEYCRFIKPYFDLYNIDKENSQLLLHLKNVISRYDLEDFAGVDYIKTYTILNKMKVDKKFNYVHKTGYICAVRWDIGIPEFYN